MALFEEKQVSAGGEYSRINLQEMEVGESFGFAFIKAESRTSEEFGDFEICAGVKFDTNAPSLDAALKDAEKASFIPNTMLQNLIDSGGLSEDGFYRIEKKWNRGDKFKGKPAKGYGYEVFKLSVPKDFIQKVMDVWNAEEKEMLQGNPAMASKKPNL